MQLSKITKKMDAVKDFRNRDYGHSNSRRVLIGAKAPNRTPVSVILIAAWESRMAPIR